MSHLAPKQDRLLLWNPTDEFLKRLSPAQTREILIAISQLSKLRIVQIDFPAGTSHPVVRQSQNQNQSEISDNDNETISTTTTSNTNNTKKEEVDASIMAGVVWLVKRAKGLTSLRLHNIDAVKTTQEFNDAVAKHPCSKDIKIVGAGTQQQAQKDSEDSKLISLSGIRHEQAVKHGRSPAGTVIIREGRGRSPVRATVHVESKQTAEYHANVRRRLKKAISKDKSKELEDESPEYDLDERRESGLYRSSSRTMQRRVSRSESPRSRGQKYMRHHNHHIRRQSYSESPKRDLHRDDDHSGHSHHNERAIKYHRSSLAPVTEGDDSNPPQVEEKRERGNRRQRTSISPTRNDSDNGEKAGNTDSTHRRQAPVSPTTKDNQSTTVKRTRDERTKSKGHLDDFTRQNVSALQQKFIAVQKVGSKVGSTFIATKARSTRLRFVIKVSSWAFVVTNWAA